MSATHMGIAFVPTGIGPFQAVRVPPVVDSIEINGHANSHPDRAGDCLGLELAGSAAFRSCACRRPVQPMTHPPPDRRKRDYTTFVFFDSIGSFFRYSVGDLLWSNTICKEFFDSPARQPSENCAKAQIDIPILYEIRRKHWYWEEPDSRSAAWALLPAIGRRRKPLRKRLNAAATT